MNKTINGWININKPINLTSTQVIGKLRHLFRPFLNQKLKIGHMGTLDPLATGVLPIAIGEATKTIPYIEEGAKEYIFNIHWGEGRSTDDAEGDIINTSSYRPTKQEILNIILNFTGFIEQIPPAYSAIKIDGKRSYDIARKGKETKLSPRSIYIHNLQLTKIISKDEAEFKTICSKGTYIRALARDIAIALKTYGYVSKLTRTQNSSFKIKDSITLDEIEQILQNQTIESFDADKLDFLLSIDTGLDGIPVLTVNKKEAEELKNGKALLAETFLRDLEIKEQQPFRIYSNHQLISIAKLDQGYIKPDRIFNL